MYIVIIMIKIKKYDNTINMKNQYDIIIVGAGLAGLSASLKLSKEKYKILLLEKENYLGGRASSWNSNGLDIEAGFHKHIGFYKELPKILEESNITLDDIVMWEKEVEIILNEKENIILGIDPIKHPITFLKDILGNNNLLTTKDKKSLSKLFIKGFKDYLLNSKSLDKYSIKEYAEKHNIEDNIIKTVVTSLSTGIFFLPIEEYSAKLFFGLFFPGLFKLHKIRIGAYKDGMSKILAEPIKKELIKNNVEIKNNINVISLIEDNKKIIGVKTNNENYYSKYVILATDIGNTKKIIKNIKHPFINKILDIQTLSVITMQIELTKPSMKLDRTTFTPRLNTIVSFSEESRSTFPNSNGRISIILKSSDKINKLKNDEIYKIVINELKSIGLNIEKDILNYRIVRHKNKFYKFSPNIDKKRPTTKTPIKGLILAGDYTKQKLYSTMEGAVISGLNAYKEILNNEKSS